MMEPAKWAAGTLDIEAGDFTAALYYFKPNAQDEPRTWMEAMATSGTVTLTTTPAACMQGTGCTEAEGSLDLNFTGTRFEIVGSD